MDKRLRQFGTSAANHVGRNFEPAGPRIEIAASGDLKPGGEVIVPLPENPLDPKELNRLLSPQEEQAIADTLNIIGGGTDADIKAAYAAFRGRPPSPEALLKKRGLIETGA